MSREQYCCGVQLLQETAPNVYDHLLSSAAGLGPFSIPRSKTNARQPRWEANNFAGYTLDCKNTT